MWGHVRKLVQVRKRSKNKTQHVGKPTNSTEAFRAVLSQELSWNTDTKLWKLALSLDRKGCTLPIYIHQGNHLRW